MWACSFVLQNRMSLYAACIGLVLRKAENNCFSLDSVYLWLRSAVYRKAVVTACNKHV
jgi:hypothetical protein